MKRYGQIDLAGNEIIDVLFENLATAPGAATGRVYFDTTDAVVEVYDGSGWKKLWAPDDDFYTLDNEGTPDGSDSILIYDDSAAVYKRQTRDNFFSDITGYLPAPVAPAGDNRYIQFNDNGSFGAQINFQWTSTDILWMAKSHTFTFLETTLIGDPGAIIQNPYATAASNKYAALSFQCRYNLTYNNYGAIILSNPTDSSYVSRFNFQVADDAGDISTPLYIDGQDGVVSNSVMHVWGTLYADSDLTVADYAKIERSGAGDAFHLRGDSTDIVFRFDGSTTWEVYTELSAGGSRLMRLGNAYLYLDTTSTWIYSNSIRMGNIGAGAGTNALKWDSLYGQVTYQSSDRRHKDNIMPWEADALGILRQFVPRQYEFKTDPGKTRVGWIAQEGLEHIPDMFPLIPKTGMYSLSESEIIPYLHRAIIQLEEEVASLKKQLDEALR